MISAQKLNNFVTIEISNDVVSTHSKILTLTIATINSGSQDFKGKINFIAPKGFRKITDQDILVEVKANERRYTSIKLLITNDAKSGDAALHFNLVGEDNIICAKKTYIHPVEINNSVQISADNSLIYRTGEEDSLRVKVRISNLGNNIQNVTLVFKIPDSAEENLFIEKQGIIGIRKDSVFNFSFKPSKNLLKQSYFNVTVTGFRNPDKEIIGSTYINIQNISNRQKFQELPSNIHSTTQKNTLSTSYKNIGDNTDIYQITGSGGFNLPAGYLFANANINMMSTQKNPIITNTYITYQREQNNFIFGNLNKMLEMPLSGRGVEYSYENLKKTRKLEIGFIDQSFSLIEKGNFLKNGYGFFIKGISNASRNSRNISSTYIFKYDPYEKVKHHLLGSDFKYNFDENWFVDTKIYGGISIYKDEHKPSASIESQYSGIIKKINLSGTYFFSTDYYPGNRRGSLQLQQNMSTKILNKHSVYTNILVSNFSPKYHFFENTLKSDNFRLDAGINFLKKKNIGFSTGYQYQVENSNTYNSLLKYFDSKATLQMTTHRITENINWSSTNKKNSAILGIETGITYYPLQTKEDIQFKISANYNYKNLNIASTYQLGSYYLSEYVFLQNNEQKSTYEKISFSAFYNTSFFKNKLSLTSGLSYTDDIMYGKSPSAFCNFRYKSNSYSLFLNSSWYNYSFNKITNNLLTWELGIALNLPQNSLKKEKKSTIQAFVFYDNNNNNSFDDGDLAADNYIININKTAFSTSKDGKISYKNIPFGEYTLKQVVQKGWYYDEVLMDVSQYNYVLNIPLHQNGTLVGKLEYDYDPKIALVFQPKFGGIIFNIYKNGVFLERIITDDNGEYITFLPSGNYSISMNESTLPTNTSTENKTKEFIVKAGEMTTISAYKINVKSKKINVKKFGK